jgi:hypothetical protein
VTSVLRPQSAGDARRPAIETKDDRMDDVTSHSITLISIIVGLGLTELLGNLYRLVRDRKRVVWDALPLAWSVFLLLFVLNYWWALVGGLAGAQQFTSVAEFALLLAQPLLLFFACSAALPRFETGQHLDMRSVYENDRRLLLLALALYQISVWATIILTRGFVWDPVAFLRTTILLLTASAFFIKSRRWDWFVVALTLASIMYRIAIQPVR